LSSRPDDLSRRLSRFSFRIASLFPLIERR
jgi:hypothetical protein